MIQEAKTNFTPRKCTFLTPSPLFNVEMMSEYFGKHTKNKISLFIIIMAFIDEVRLMLIFHELADVNIELGGRG